MLSVPVEHGKLTINETIRPPESDGSKISRARRSARAIGANRQASWRTARSRGKIAKDVFEIVWSEGGDPRAIVETRGLKQVTDLSALEEARRRHYRQESGQGRRRQDQSEGGRLVCRPGDEGFGRQSQPASGQRSARRSVSASERALRARRCARKKSARTLRVGQNGGENLRREGRCTAPDAVA